MRALSANWTRIVQKPVKKWVGQEVSYRSKYVWERRGDLRGRELTFAVVEYPPFVVMHDDSVLGGHNVEFVSELAARMNFTLRLQLHRDEETNKSGASFFRMVASDLESGRVDSAAHSMYRTPERLARFSMSAVLYKVNQVLATRRDMTSAGEERGSLFSVFGPDVWAAGGGTVLALILAASAASLLSSGDEESNQSHRVLDDSSILFGALLAQGSHRNMDRLSTKLLLLVALAFGVLAVSSLSARLISILSIQRYKSLVEDLDDVVRLSLPLYVNDGGYVEFAFRDAPEDSMRRRLWERQIVLRDYVDEADLIEEFLQLEEKAALVIHPMVVHNQRHELGCRLHIRKLRGQITTSLPFRKGFPYLPTVDYHLTRMRQAGIIDRLRNKYKLGSAHEGSWEQFCGSSSRGDDGRWEAGMDNTKSFFLLLLAGSAVSLAVAAVECLFTRSLQKTGRRDPTGLKYT